VVAAASDLGACVCEDDATVSERADLLARVAELREQRDTAERQSADHYEKWTAAEARVAELEAERDEARDLDAMDDAVHVASPWEPRKSLCGQWNRRNLAPLDGPSLDEGSGCWSCMDAAKWIHDRSRVQAEQIAALQEALKEIAAHPVVSDPGDDEGCDWRCTAELTARAKDALALAEGCAAPADEETP